MRRSAMAAGLLLALSAAPVAQNPAAFEVASIHEHQFVPGSVVGVEYHAGGRLTANAPIQLLITSAYGILPAQLQSAPGVFHAGQPVLYDIEAKVGPGMIPSGHLSKDSIRLMQLMLQTLLADRFKLRVHLEKRELPVYALVLEKGGLKLQKALTRDCDVTPSPCGWKSAGPASGVTGFSVTLDRVADLLGVFLDRSVVDRTGVGDAFDVNLPPFSRGAQLAGATADGAPVDVTAPSLFAVLRDVGLRLDSRTQLLDVYVVDHVEKPSVN